MGDLGRMWDNHDLETACFTAPLVWKHSVLYVSFCDRAALLTLPANRSRDP